VSATNFVFMTGHVDYLKPDAADRRYWVIRDDVSDEVVAALRRYIAGRRAISPTDIRALRQAGYLAPRGNVLEVTAAGWAKWREGGK
jgi:hypothetical protein